MISRGERGNGWTFEKGARQIAYCLHTHREKTQTNTIKQEKVMETLESSNLYLNEMNHAKYTTTEFIYAGEKPHIFRKQNKELKWVVAATFLFSSNNSFCLRIWWICIDILTFGTHWFWMYRIFQINIPFVWAYWTVLKSNRMHNSEYMMKMRYS